MGFGKPTKKQLSEAQNRESDELFNTIGQVANATQHRDAIVTATLASIEPNPNNGRLGQQELMSAMPLIVEKISSLGADDVPSFNELGITLGPAAAALYENCAELANTYIAASGYADTPPKVLPADNRGVHRTKTGHRRYIAYLLAQPITKIDRIDVILDKSREAGDELFQTISEITENTSRENNTLAEELLQIKRVLLHLGARKEKINKAKLSRQTGLERSKLSRLVDIVEAGGADDEDRLLKIHEAGIEDVTALSLVFKAEQGAWDALIEELGSIGPTSFRAKHSSKASGGKVPKSVAVPHSGQEAIKEPGSEHFPKGGDSEREPPEGETFGREQAITTPKESGVTGEVAGESPEPRKSGPEIKDKPAQTSPQGSGGKAAPDQLLVTEKEFGPGIERLIALLEEQRPDITKKITEKTPAGQLRKLLTLLGNDD
jgi:hypothetical protein|tara:strand:+ start:626 stop:1930 length:1305 start_codon:yes stop_codon:yes gene_type:complete